MDQVDGRRKPSSLKLKPETIELFAPLKTKLFFCRVPIPFQWQGFFGDYIDNDSPENSSFFKTKITQHASFLCFIYDEKDNV